jgi:hypothetical protein
MYVAFADAGAEVEVDGLRRIFTPFIGVRSGQENHPEQEQASRSRERPCYYHHPSVSPLCYVCMYVCRVRERGRSSAPCSMESGSIPAGVQWFLCCATSCESSCCDGTAKYVAAAAAGTRTFTHSQVTNLECMWEKESTCVSSCTCVVIVRAVAVILSAVVVWWWYLVVVWW